MNEVVIVGCGPTGLMSAGSWRWRGSMSRLSGGDRRRCWWALARLGSTHAPLRSSTSVESPTGSLPRDKIAQAARFGTVTLDVSDFPSRYPSGIRTRWGCGRTASSEPSGLAVCRSNVKLPPQSKRLEVAGSRNLQES